jgi:anti-sigma factor ChrR (cupin superfamily)
MTLLHRLASFQQVADALKEEAAMTTLEPRATPGMSYLAEGDLEWEAQTPASRRKILRLEEDLYVAIVQWDAGFELPGVDEHGGEEIVYVLDGTFTDQYRSSGPGTIIRGEAGSSHRPGTPDGVTFCQPAVRSGSARRRR